MKGWGGYAIGWVLLGCVPGAAAERPAAIPPATAIVAVETAVRPEAVTITIHGNGALSPGRIRQVEHFRPRLVMDFPGLAAGAAAATPVEIDPVDRVRVDRHSVELTRVVLELVRSAPYRVESAEPLTSTLRVVFPRDPPVAPAAGAAGAPRAPARPGVPPPAASAVPPPAASAVPRPAAPTVPPPAAPTVPPPAAPTVPPPAAPAVPPPAAYADPGQPAPAAAENPAGTSRRSARYRPAWGGSRRARDVAPPKSVRFPGQPAGGGPVYTGDEISMDFQNADLRAVLRTFADISTLNIVIDSSVQGEVNVALTQVPWDQAFDVILRANGLGYEIEGTVVRIASIERLQQEAGARALLAQREAEAGELVVFTRTLSYARADDLVPLLTSTFLSPRGEVFTDPRTNTLIIRDLEDRLSTLDDLLDTLDRTEPQVEIEARIVRAGHDSARALGVQWGLGGRGSANGGGTDASSAGQGASGSEVRAPDENVAVGIGLGLAAPTSVVGATLGSADGPLNLDVVLSALESQGELRIISSPRVTTQNNVQAEILQGDQIPYQTVANNTVTVQFKEAALTLRVTPQITAAATVIMQVEVENSFADFARALGNPPIPAIVTQRAATTVQVGDGETAVIGGIYENARSEQNSRTPGLHRIPLLGWLFKSTSRNESTDELMIFLTPRIVKR